MSDASTPPRKISREGIVLIKSFEGFRPRAVQRPESGWIIGYGHTLSAREGASVSEGDAELLLRYDLLAIEKSVNTAAPGVLNQHQFDAVVSFGFSVGREQFETSDVLTRLSVGAPNEAAEAMMAWPAAEMPNAGLRRRAAERALFGADPSRPISLAELLTVPVPEAAVMEAIVETPAIEPVDSRGAAVAALLGEPQVPIVEPDPIVPSFATAEVLESGLSNTSTTGAWPVPVEDDSLAGSSPVDTAGEALVTVAANDAEATANPGLPAQPDQGATETASDVLPIELREALVTEGRSVAGELPETASPTSDMAALTVQRYAPYGTPIVGPLPFLQPAASIETRQPTESAEALQPTEASPARFESRATTETLILTSPEDVSQPVLARPAWTADEREEAGTIAQAETGLFGDDLSLIQGGQPLGRPDFEPEAPVGFDWSETGAFIIMGAVGLTAFGASMAAFRLASEQGGGDETSVIGWVLAVIGVACVGVSSLNLYRRFGLPGGDR